MIINLTSNLIITILLKMVNLLMPNLNTEGFSQSLLPFYQGRALASREQNALSREQTERIGYCGVKKTTRDRKEEGLSGVRQERLYLVIRPCSAIALLIAAKGMLDI